MSTHSKKNMDRILYVDDTIANLLLFKYMFEEKYNITCEPDPLKALYLLKNNKFDIVISDYEMPKMDGIELLEILKNNYPEIIRVMLTSHTEYDLELEAKRRCDCEFLTKPISKSRIEKILTSKVFA